MLIWELRDATSLAAALRPSTSPPESYSAYQKTTRSGLAMITLLPVANNQYRG
jgi:hypothetical protein